MLFAFISDMGNLFWEAGHIRDMIPHKADHATKRIQGNL